MNENSKMSETLHGCVDSINFRNEENGYTVLTLEDDEGQPVTVVGIIPYVNEGDSINAVGSWVEHRIYGRQFSVESFERTLPEEEDGILRYLASGAVRGIGPKTAQKIVERFGTDSLNVMESNPEWLAAIPGISADKAKAIGENFQSISGSREFMMFSRELLSPATAMRVYKKWGSGAVERIRKDPYSLAGSFRGIGFKRADSIASSLGLPHDSEQRIRAGLLHILSSEATKNGHTCLPEETLSDCAASLLFGEAYGDAERDKISAMLETMLKESRIYSYVTDEGTFIYHPYIYKAECYCAKKLCELSRLCPRTGEEDIGLLIDKSELASGIRYAPMQKLAIADALRGGILVLTGGPGTGKTTIIKGLLNIFDSLDCSVCLAAPTGRAAKRMSEATGHEAKTVHRLLEMEWSEDGEASYMRCESNPIEERVIIVDEASMMDVLLAEALLRALRGGSRLILIGDSDQLPSVGCGNVLADIIASESFRVVRLDRVFRQSDESKIITNAHRINTGLMPELSSKGTDFFFLERVGDELIAKTVCELVTTRLPKSYGHAISDKIQIITPSRRGAAGTEHLNLLLQHALNPPSPQKGEKKSGSVVFRAGDRVMQTKNNYHLEWETTLGESGLGVYNGDIGVIESVDTERECVTVCYDEKRFEYDYPLLEELDHAYAVTVHKSQGSEYPVVIIPLYRCAPMLQTRNLLYTAVTRAQRMVILVGERAVLTNMVENDYHASRCTMLSRMLKREAVL